MIITQRDTSGVVTNGLGTESRQLGIKATGWAHLSTILRDSLYKDKILAPMRELSTNAMDAHVEKGTPNRPIIVKLPNKLLPTFAVRDFGLGMSEERVWDIFANYGESTKRSSNEQTGMLGIGSKSPFAYTDSFTIINYHKGVKSIFICHIATSAEGSLNRVSRESTTEEDGLEVQFAVRPNDIGSFIDTARRFFQYWEVQPVFEGSPANITPVEKEFFGDDWYLPKNPTNHYAIVIMGNISYPIDVDSIRLSENSFFHGDDAYQVGRIFSKGLVITAKIGDVDVAASREGLQYTDKTRSFISNTGIKVLKELEKVIAAKFNSCSTTFEKKLLYGKFNSYNSPLTSLSFLVNRFSQYSGSYIIYNRWGMTSSNDSGLEVSTYTRSRRGNRRVRVHSTNASDIRCDENYRYILHDNTTDTKILNRTSYKWSSS
jgi:hypothetical protein